MWIETHRLPRPAAQGPSARGPDAAWAEGSGACGFTPLTEGVPWALGTRGPGGSLLHTEVISSVPGPGAGTGTSPAAEA